MTDQLFVRDPTLVMREITSLRQQVETLTQENTTMREHMLPPLWKRIEDMKTQLASLAAAQERMTWQPIETAPKQTWVQVGWADQPTWQPQTLMLSDDGIWGDEDDCNYRQPTHWMPLPKSPALPALPSLAASSRETTDETKDALTRRDNSDG